MLNGLLPLAGTDDVGVHPREVVVDGVFLLGFGSLFQAGGY